MKKILVFGATGNIGVYVTTILKEKGFEVIATGYRKNDKGFFEKRGITYISADINDKESLRKLPNQNIFAVIHLAGMYPAKMKDYYAETYLDSIIKGSFNILEFCRENKVDRIVFGHSRADSNYLMGTKNLIPSDIVKKFPLTGDHSVYSICKNTVVDLIEHYNAAYGLKGFVLRMPTIYVYAPSPYYYVNGEKKWMAYRWIMEQAIQGNPIEVWGDPSLRKEIIYIKDFVQIIQKCLNTKSDGGVYNVGSGIGVSLLEQIEGIVEVFSSSDKKSELIFLPKKPNARQFIHDISKTENELGFKQEYDYKSLLIDFKYDMDNNPYSAILGKPEDYVEKVEK